MTGQAQAVDRDMQLELCQAAWREGFTAAATQFASFYRQGAADAVADMERRDLIVVVRDGIREDFGSTFGSDHVPGFHL